ncbi:hypothetical protein ACIO8F_37465 [Streptomyces sp. NPDC087228]|uniref:hypothetical protein n=1 Tax=unclassified Streptomyces TaxID=2593676 RepID=UPI00382EEEE8
MSSWAGRQSRKALRTALAAAWWSSSARGDTPKSEFVERFVGADRGFRALSFVAAGDLPLRTPATVRLGDGADEARAIADRTAERWLLTTDADGLPIGWADTQQLVTGVERESLRPLGATFTAAGSVRSALDAALASPCGQAVRIDDKGAAVGVVAATEITQHIADRREQLEPAT